MFNKEKTYFRKKAEAVQRMIWDMTFKRFKTLEIREGVRKEYDNLRAKLEHVQSKIKDGEKKSGLDKGEFERLKDQDVVLNRDIERLKAQIDGLDIEVHGSKPTAEIPGGHQGLTEQLGALRELKVMINEYIKEI